MRLCNKCAKLYEDDFSFCPHCGTPRAHDPTSKFQALESPSPQVGAMDNLQEQAGLASRKPPTVDYFWLYVGLALSGAVIMMLAIGMHDSHGSGSDRNTSSRQTVSIGDEAHLVCSDPGSKALPLGTTDKDFDALVSAQMAHDKYGIAQLMISHKVFTVPCGTRILLLYNGFTMDQVRVLEGEQTGAAGWTYRESVQH